MTKATTKLERITPEVAHALLARNTRNRALVQRRVDALAADILGGRWRVTHQGIAFAEDGTLIDGQHRLAAIVAAGVPVTTLVTRGLPVEAIDAIDTGKSRRAGDVLAIADGTHLNSNERAALFAAHTLALTGTLMTGRVRLDVHALRAAIVEHRKDLVAVYDGLGRSNDRLSAAAITGSLAIAARTRPDEVAEFAAQLRSGANLPDGSPALILRRFVLERYTGGGNSVRERLSLVVFGAFDAFVRSVSRARVFEAPAIRARYLRPWRPEE